MSDYQMNNPLTMLHRYKSGTNFTSVHYGIQCIIMSKCFFFFSPLMANHLPTIWETQVQSLGWEDLLEKEMATHSSILAWKILWMEEPGRLQSMGSQSIGHDWATSLSFRKSYTWNVEEYSNDIWETVYCEIHVNCGCFSFSDGI